MFDRNSKQSQGRPKPQKRVENQPRTTTKRLVLPIALVHLSPIVKIHFNTDSHPFAQHRGKRTAPHKRLNRPITRRASLVGRHGRPTAPIGFVAMRRLAAWHSGSLARREKEAAEDRGGG